MTVNFFPLKDAMVGFTMADYMVFEVNGSVSVCVSLTGYVERPVVVTVVTLEGSAVGEIYYCLCFMVHITGIPLS